MTLVKAPQTARNFGYSEITKNKNLLFQIRKNHFQSATIAKTLQLNALVLLLPTIIELEIKQSELRYYKNMLKIITLLQHQSCIFILNVQMVYRTIHLFKLCS